MLKFGRRVMVGLVVGKYAVLDNVIFETLFRYLLLKIKQIQKL